MIEVLFIKDWLVRQSILEFKKSLAEDIKKRFDIMDINVEKIGNSYMVKIKPKLTAQYITTKITIKGTDS